MKKTLVALAVMAAATSAQAIELYNQDGVTVNMSGDVEVRYKQATKKNSDLVQEIDDAEFGFDTRYQVNDAFQVGAFVEFSGIDEDRAKGGASVGDVYFGFYHNELGSLKVGKLATQLDDAGIGSDYLFGIKSFVNDADVSGEEALRYDFDNGDFYFGLGYIEDNHEAQKIGKDGSHFDLKAGYRVADFDFTAFYGQADLRGTVDGDTYNSDNSLFALEARYAGVENLNLELGYYQAEEKEAGAKVKPTTIAFAADYSIEKTTFAAGLSSTDVDVNGSDDVLAWFVNVGYGIAPNTTVYAEVGGTDEDTTDTGYGFGIKASW